MAIISQTMLIRKRIITGERCCPRYEVVFAAAIALTMACTPVQPPTAYTQSATDEKPQPDEKPQSEMASKKDGQTDQPPEDLPEDSYWSNRRDPFMPIIFIPEEPEEEEVLPEVEQNVSAEDVTEQLDESKQVREGLIGEGIIGDFAVEWYGFNDMLNEAVGLDLGIAYTALYQYATSDGVPHEGASGDFDFFGSWHLVGQEGKNAGHLTFATEGRHAFTTYTPSEIGPGIGSLWGTADGFNTQEFSLTQLWWSQQLLRDRFRLRIGKLDQGTFIDNNRFKSASFYFLNRAFSSNPTLPFPASGLGIGGRYVVADSVQISFGYSNANAVKTEIDFDTMDEHEYFGTAEFRYSPKILNRGKGNYRLTAWHVDERKKAGIPSGYGLSLSLDQEIGNGLIPFFRYGIANGGVTATRQMLSGGIGIESPFGIKEDLVGIGIAWGNPKVSFWRDQYVAEIFYRNQFTPNIRLTPGYQIIIHPSNAPDDDAVSVFELRLRLTF